MRLPTRKAESLLAYLVLHPGSHAREKLAALFWGDSPDRQARTSLRVALLALRRQLAGELLLTEHEAIQLNPSCPLWVDALAFETNVSDPSDSAALQAGIDLCGGELLTESYDDWVLPLRERYRGQYLAALLYLARDMRAHSDYERAASYAQKMLAVDPADERAYQQLMFCHVAQGDRSGALKKYDECRQALSVELDVEPLRETTALFQWIKQAPLDARAPDARPTNLPIPLTSFIGRLRDITELKRLLTTTRLLTLAGAGGCGKTRLAIRVATDLIDAFKDGVWWVELAALADASLVPYAVAKTLAVREVPNQSMSERLSAQLRAKQMLIVLDNCEHLVSACAQLSAQLLQACPQLKILATSRETLGLTGETIWRVPALSLPPAASELRVQALGLQDAAQELMQSEAAQLFIARAGAIRPEFTLNEQNTAAVAELCRRLDGIPLALELAAARVNVLSPAELVARLADRFRLLTVGSRAATPRQQTLRATLDWSYELLDHDEKAVLRRLSVFAGGFTEDAAAFVCERDVLDLLQHLTDKSLIVAEPFAKQTRFTMLETIREYAREKLLAANEAEAAQRRHFECYMQLALQAEPHLVGPQQAVWFERLERELDNVRAGLEWVLARRDATGDADLRESALRFAVALGQFWYVRGRLGEGRRWLERLSQDGGDLLIRHTALTPDALYWRGFLAWQQGDYATARGMFEASRRIAEELGDKVGLARALRNQGMVLTGQGEHAAARAVLDESLALLRALGDRTEMAACLFVAGRVAWFQGDLPAARALLEQGLAVAQAAGNPFVRGLALSTLGDVTWSEGNYPQARAQHSEALAAFRALGNPQNMATALLSLGYVDWAEGSYEAARERFRECLALYSALGDQWGIAGGLEGLACVSAADEELERAVQLFAAAHHSRSVFGGTHPIFPEAYERSLANARAALGEETFARLWALGHAMAVDNALAYAMGNPGAGQSSP